MTPTEESTARRKRVETSLAEHGETKSEVRTIRPSNEHRGSCMIKCAEKRNPIRQMHSCWKTNPLSPTNMALNRYPPLKPRHGNPRLAAKAPWRAGRAARTTATTPKEPTYL